MSAAPLPWQKYAQSPAQAPPAGPWQKYSAAPAPQPAPPAEKPGVLSTLWGNIKSIPSSLMEPDPLVTLPWQQGLSDEEKNKLVTQQQDAAAATNARRSQMHGPIYPIAASGMEMIGAPISSMEQHAEEGNPRAVIGDALTLPTLMGAGEVLRAAAPRVVPPVVRYGVRAAEDVANSHLNPFRAAANINVPADEASALRIKVPGRDFGLSIARPQAVAPELTTPSRTLPGQISPEVIRPPASPIPPRAGLALPPGPEPLAGSMVRSIAQPIQTTNIPEAPLISPEDLGYRVPKSPRQATYAGPTEDFLARIARQEAANPKPQGPEMPDRMDPISRAVWQQHAFNEAPAADVLAKTRAANPPPVEATTRAATEAPPMPKASSADLRARIAQIMKEIEGSPESEQAPEAPVLPASRPLIINGQVVPATADLTAGLEESVRRANPKKPPIQ